MSACRDPPFCAICWTSYVRILGHSSAFGDVVTDVVAVAVAAVVDGMVVVVVVIVGVVALVTVANVVGGISSVHSRVPGT